MKNLITTVACTMLLMAFVVQFAYQQSLFQQIVNANYVVETFEKELLEEKGITNEIEERLCAAVSETMQCSEEEISLNCEDRKGKLYYEVRFPVSKLFAMPDFWGISEEANQTTYVITREIKQTIEKDKREE